MQPGDELVMQVRGSSVVCAPKPHIHNNRLRGLHDAVQDIVDPETYGRQEQGAWKIGSRS